MSRSTGRFVFFQMFSDSSCVLKNLRTFFLYVNLLYAYSILFLFSRATIKYYCHKMFPTFDECVEVPLEYFLQKSTFTVRKW